MENSNRFLDVLWSLVLQLPSLLTMLACIMAAIIRWRRHPKVSLALATGLGLLILHAFIFALVYAFVPELFARPGNYGMMRTVVNVITFLYNSSLAIAFGILLLAVFMKRSVAGFAH
jgi:uncharacterized BrkB/YihY/UPF0761 family membrane protein